MSYVVQRLRLHCQKNEQQLIEFKVAEPYVPEPYVPEPDAPEAILSKSLFNQ